MIYYIVESPHRGCVVKIIDGKPKCSWSCLRSAEKVFRFHDIKEAAKISTMIPKSYILQVNKNVDGTHFHAHKVAQ